MDFQPAHTSPARPVPRRAAAAAAVLALALYAAMLVRNVGAVAGGSDSSGYMNHARLLASGHVHAQPRTIEGLPTAAVAPFLYVPLGFKPARDGNGIVPTYPTGFSLFVLAMKPLAGWRHAGDLTIILHSLAGLAVTYALGRTLGLGALWSALGASMLAASPLYIFMSVQAMSDVPSLAWTTLAVLAALGSRERPGWAAAAGAAIAIDVLLRPSNALAFMPVAVALGTSPRRWALFASGGLPGAAFFCVHSFAAYGGIGSTGYGDVSDSFGLKYVEGSAANYARWLPVLFTPLVALAFGIPWLKDGRTGTRRLLLAWILPFVVFYSAYVCTHETWWYLRFLLPAIPAIVVGALLVLRSLCAGASGDLASWRARLVFATAVAIFAASAAWSNHSIRPLSTGSSERRYLDLADWMQKNVPQDAVCLTMQASGALFYYTHFTFIRWDFVGSANAATIESALRSAKRPLYAVLFPFELNAPDGLTRMPGLWTRVGSVNDVVIMRCDLGMPKA
jgi:hypothetical protein